MINTMNENKFLVDILDEKGTIVSNKPRNRIVKGTDIYHATFGVVVTPDSDIAVSVIADRQDLPNIHHGKLGCTAATIRRTNETALQAMQRAAKDELGIEVTPKLLHEDFIAVDGTYRKISIYIIRSGTPTSFSTADIDEIKTYSLSDFRDLIANQPERITPLLKLFWEKYSNHRYA